VESYFTERGIPYSCRDIRRDGEARREWRERYGGEIVPMVVFDHGRRIVDGCDIPAVERTLRELAAPP
jgi:glutaredoxin